jgi:hypothetical protein
MIRLITDTVRDGGCIFVGDNSVLARLAHGADTEQTNGADAPSK